MSAPLPALPPPRRSRGERMKIKTRELTLCAVLSALALFDPFQDIVGGMFSIPAIVYYLSVIGLFLFLTGQALERRRWN